jgi:hypothetical protein
MGDGGIAGRKVELVTVRRCLRSEPYSELEVDRTRREQMPETTRMTQSVSPSSDSAPTKSRLGARFAPWPKFVACEK